MDKRSPSRSPAFDLSVFVVLGVIAAAGCAHRPSAAPPPSPPTAPSPDLEPGHPDDDQKWNTLYGKVLSGTASDEEIGGYYDHLRQRSEAAIRVAEQALLKITEPLTDLQGGLLTLIIRMNRDRLATIPLELEEARARKRLQDRRRQEFARSSPPP
jgi:hypothetical protein